MDQLYMLRAFVAAARYQSFSKAAESLNVTTGSISKAIAKLSRDASRHESCSGRHGPFR
jgi:DNA-binding transcriptional LysR family regulator